MPGKSGELGKPHSLEIFVIWREILLYGIKKYIRNCGKFSFLVGNLTHIDGEFNIFPDLSMGAVF